MRDFGLDILKEDEGDVPNKVHLPYNNTLSIVPEEGINYYDVSHKHFNGVDLELDKRLDYSVSVEYLDRDVSKKQHFWRVDKNNVFFNQKQPSLVFEEISVKLIEVIYPINIATDYSGQVVGITNHEEILARWPDNREKIILEYKGRLVYKFLQKFEKLIEDSTKLEISLSKEVFWPVFFSNRHLKYGDSCKKKIDFLFPLEAYATPIIYNGVMELSLLLEDNDTIELTYQGESVVPSSSKLYHKREEHRLTSDLEIKYHLEATTKIPTVIKVIYDIYDETKKEDVLLTEVFITLNEQGNTNKVNQSVAEEQPSFKDTDEKPKKKKWFSLGF